MRITPAIESDADYILERDKHIAKDLVMPKIQQGEILVIRKEEERIGWLRHGYFWDHIPFLNMIWIDEPYRGQGIGTETMLHWETFMSRKGFRQVMTSTMSNEESQHFYRKLGYKDAGCLLLENEALEIILTKKI